jgi:hypothetical protein
MTYTFKLARRLAISRHFAMLPVLLLFAGCTGGDATSPDNSPVDVPGSGIYAWRPRESTPVALFVSPSSVIVETNQLLQFRARGRNRAGDEVVAPVAWSTTGGTILPDGRFSAASVGMYQVAGSARTSDGTDVVQTSTITVVRRQAKLKSVVVTPSSAMLNPGVSQTFAATGRLAGGDTVPIGVTWTAKGGTIDAGGLYVAGDTVGTFQVIAIRNAGTLADTATITISAPPSPPPPSDSVIAPAPPTIPIEPAPPPPDTAPTPPAPVLAQVTLLPASLTLAPGTTKQLSTYGRTTTGDSTAVNVAFSATGGTVTAGGLFTAGSSAGSFRVIASIDGLADTSSVTITVPLGTTTPSGIPFGAFDSWDVTTLKPYTNAFTATVGPVNATMILDLIAAARTKHMKLILAMTGGSHDKYMSIINGVYQFDMVKWQGTMQTYNTSAIKTAVASAIADGTIIGNFVMDEPNVSGAGDGNTWGPAGTMTKIRVDSMCGYVKTIFPALPVGVAHGHNTFEPGNSYRVCEFLLDQYVWRKGDVTTYRDDGLALARRDGMSILFSVNLLNGGVPDRDGIWDCSGTGGMGTYAPNCRMTPQQVRDWGILLGSAGCALTMWRYDGAFVLNADNQQAFNDVRSRLATLPAKSCRRP